MTPSAIVSVMATAEQLLDAIATARSSGGLTVRQWELLDGMERSVRDAREGFR